MLMLWHASRNSLNCIHQNDIQFKMRSEYGYMYHKFLQAYLMEGIGHLDSYTVTITS